MKSSDLIWLIVGATAPSFLISWLVAFAVRRWAPRWGLVDQPGIGHKTHGQPTPLGGGLAIWAGVMLAFATGQLLLWLLPACTWDESLAPRLLLEHAAGLRSKAPEVWFLLSSASLLMVLGLADDILQLGWRVRLLGQLVVVAAGVYLFDHWRLTVYLDLPLLTGLLSIVWIVGLINSFNMLDNMDGLSAGVAAISAVMLAATMLMLSEPEGAHPQMFVAGFLLVLAGSLLGFLWHNLPRARLFMGDAGSYFIGYCIGVATILATFAGHTNASSHTILAPLCVMAVPFYDMLTVIAIRVRHGRSPFDADRSHFSHRLVDLGFSRPLAVLTIYLATFICGLASLLLHQVNRWGALLIMLLVVSILVLIGILETIARRKVAAQYDASQVDNPNSSS